MKNKITSILVVLLSCLMLSIPAFAINVSADEISTNEISTNEISTNEISTNEISTNEISTNEISTNEISTNEKLPRLVDRDNLLSDIEETDLIKRLDEVSEAHKCDIVIVTVDSIGNSTATDYADDFFDYNGYGFGDSHDGILLLISLEERDWAISTTGKAIQVFTDSGLSYIESKFKPHLSNGNYAKSFNIFVDCCEDFLIEAENDRPYDIDNKPIQPPSLQNAVISIFLGFILAFIIVNILKSSLKTVRKQPMATEYMRQGSMRITNQNDRYLYNNVSKIRRDTTSSSSGSRSRGGSRTHRSSSGRRHGGSSGKF